MPPSRSPTPKRRKPPQQHHWYEEEQQQFSSQHQYQQRYQDENPVEKQVDGYQVNPARSSSEKDPVTSPSPKRTVKINPPPPPPPPHSKDQPEQVQESKTMETEDSSSHTHLLESMTKQIQLLTTQGTQRDEEIRQLRTEHQLLHQILTQMSKLQYDLKKAIQVQDPTTKLQQLEQQLQLMNVGTTMQQFGPSMHYKSTFMHQQRNLYNQTHRSASTHQRIRQQKAIRKRESYKTNKGNDIKNPIIPFCLPENFDTQKSYDSFFKIMGNDSIDESTELEYSYLNQPKKPETPKKDSFVPSFLHSHSQHNAQQIPFSPSIQQQQSQPMKPPLRKKQNYLLSSHQPQQQDQEENYAKSQDTQKDYSRQT